MDFRELPAADARPNPYLVRRQLRDRDGREANIASLGQPADVEEWPEWYKRCEGCDLILRRDEFLHAWVESRWHQVGDKIHEWQQAHECDPPAPDACPIVHAP